MILAIVLGVVLAGLVAFLVGKWLFKKDTEIENRRRAAAQLAATLKSYGLKHTPDFLIDYSVGDYSGMGKRIAKLVELMTSGEAAILAELDDVYSRVLDAQLKTESGRALVQAKLGATSVAPKPATVLA